MDGYSYIGVFFINKKEKVYRNRKNKNIRSKITLSEKSQSEEATYCMNSIMRQFGKGNLWRM